MSKVILVLSDALRYDVAKDSMGFLGHLVENKKASLYKIVGELPSMSRPMYETIHTGVPSSEHGIIANSISRLSKMPNIFSAVSAAGKVTAAAAYGWYSELYNRTPYNIVDDREVDDASLPIQHGRFYLEDSFPDNELFAAAAWLVRKFMPDFLLVHPMGMDYLGEMYGSDSKEYRNHAIHQDMWLAPFMPEWAECGYTIFVTGDHGMNKDGGHGGTTPEQRTVPFFAAGPNRVGRGDTGETISQLQIAPTVLRLLDVPIPGTMKHKPLSFD